MSKLQCLMVLIFILLLSLMWKSNILSIILGMEMLMMFMFFMICMLKFQMSTIILFMVFMVIEATMSLVLGLKLIFYLMNSKILDLNFVKL